jgi:Ca2+-binding RTX toxin-like protein
MFVHDISGFEQVFGTAGSDRLIGNSQHNTLNGAAGNDWFRSGKGDDLLRGGSGADTFVYTKTDASDGTNDRIADFEIGLDRLDLSDFLKSTKDWASALHLETSDAGTLVQAAVKGTFVDVVLLENVTATSLEDIGLFA